MSKKKLYLTQSLADRVRELQDKEGHSGQMLRVSVKGGGCSGFQYGFEFDESKNDDDHIFEKDDIKVVIDDISLGFLDDAVIDFVNDLNGAFFHVENPNAQSSCGCGTSFSI